MLLDVGDKQYAVHFSHYRIPVCETGCSIHEGRCKVKGCAELIHPYRGLAICHENDQFNKAVGRKISLGRALQPLPRELRKQIWYAYFKLSPHR